jgi:hypothetical protein
MNVNKMSGTIEPLGWVARRRPGEDLKRARKGQEKARRRPGDG